MAWESKLIQLLDSRWELPVRYEMIEGKSLFSENKCSRCKEIPWQHHRVINGRILSESSFSNNW